MTDTHVSRMADRRAAVERQILDAAWSVMAREGAAALSVREVARSVGLRQQSLTYYFPTKQALLDALFADGFSDLRAVLDRVPRREDPIDAVVSVAEAVVGYCVEHPARYHLMLQRTVPGFAPSDASHDVALGVLGTLVDRLLAAGVSDPADIALVRGLISGLASEQIANDPGGRGYVGHVGRGIRALLSAVTTSAGPSDIRR
ncbi:TetR/AcrR family transcriptional regulator [Geodermatophilus sp. SYSU D01176]